MGVFIAVGQSLTNGYALVINNVPAEYVALINVFIFSLLISLYALFTWKFYNFLAKKDLLGLDLASYNPSKHPTLKKTFAVMLYLIEYLIILPVLIFFWFSILAVIILVMSDEPVALNVLMIAAAIVASTRILSYYEEELAKDVAKLLPLTMLAIFVTSEKFFTLPRVFESLAQLPSFGTHILYFLIFITGTELILRALDLIFDRA